MNLGEKILYLRKKKGISQEILAKGINVSREDVSKWEENLVKPEKDNLMKLCKYFNVSLDYISEEEDIKAADKERHREVENNNGFKFIFAGLILSIITVVSTYPAKIFEFNSFGEAFTNELSYLSVFPFNLVLDLSLVLFVIGFYKIITRRREK